MCKSGVVVHTGRLRGGMEAEGGREGRGRGGKETERGGRVKEGREVGGSGINTHAIAAYCVR